MTIDDNNESSIIKSPITESPIASDNFDDDIDDNIDDNTNSNQRSLIKVIYRFLSGAALGILALLIPVTYMESNNFGLIQIGVALVFIVACGLLSILWGQQFVDSVTRTLNSTGL